MTAMILTGCVLLVALAAASAAPAKLELLGQPCRAKNVLAAITVTDRATGRDMFVLTNMNEATGAELIFVDPEKNTGKVYHAPAGAGGWALKEVPEDRLVMGTFYDGTFMVFDLKKMEFTKSVQFPGESYIWNLAIGSDGRIYGGSYGNGKLGAFDLNNYTVEDCGAPAPPNLYLRYVSSTPDGRIFCLFNTEKVMSKIYDPATKTWEDAPKQLQGVNQGVTWNGYFLAGSHAYQGKALEEVTPLPFPAPPADKGSWVVNNTLTTDDTIYINQGSTLYRYKKGDKDLTPICSIDFRGGSIRAVMKNGNMLGVRGQDYFIIKPGDKDVQMRPIPAESGPRPMLFLRVDPEGRIWTGPHFGQTLTWMDPRTKKAVNTSTICGAGGEVYDVAFYKGKVYAVAYAGGDIVEYDPAQPWDQWHGKNPRILAKVGGKYIRPEPGVTLGPDGKLYAGWWIRYGEYGGAVSITDPETGKTELIENPLGAQAIGGIATDETFIYVGTNLAANGLPTKKGESPRFGVIDTATKKVVFQQEFAGAYGLRLLGYDAATKRVAASVNGKVNIFDTVTREFTNELKDVPNVSSRSVAAAGDGTILYGSEKSVVRLDLKTGKVTVIVEAPDKIDNVAVGPDGSMYISCGVDVYAVKM